MKGRFGLVSVLAFLIAGTLLSFSITFAREEEDTIRRYHEDTIRRYLEIREERSKLVERQVQVEEEIQRAEDRLAWMEERLSWLKAREKQLEEDLETGRALEQELERKIEILQKQAEENLPWDQFPLLGEVLSRIPGINTFITVITSPLLVIKVPHEKLKEGTRQALEDYKKQLQVVRKNIKELEDCLSEIKNKKEKTEEKLDELRRFIEEAKARLEEMEEKDHDLALEEARLKPFVPPAYTPSEEQLEKLRQQFPVPPIPPIEKLEPSWYPIHPSEAERMRKEGLLKKALGLTILAAEAFAQTGLACEIGNANKEAAQSYHIAALFYWIIGDKEEEPENKLENYELAGDYYVKVGDAFGLVEEFGRQYDMYDRALKRYKEAIDIAAILADEEAVNRLEMKRDEVLEKY
jgi:chromosome segregation ATPase